MPKNTTAEKPRTKLITLQDAAAEYAPLYVVARLGPSRASPPGAARRQPADLGEAQRPRRLIERSTDTELR
jgi:hypothetical protein